MIPALGSQLTRQYLCNQCVSLVLVLIVVNIGDLLCLLPPSGQQMAVCTL